MKSIVHPEMNKPREHGFTLFELILVLILLAVLAGIALPRILNNTGEERAAADKLKTHLRFAQMQSLGSSQSWGVQGNGEVYYLFRVDVPQTRVYFPGESHDSVKFPFGSFQVTFDEWGRPYNSLDTQGSTATVEIPVGSKIIRIEQETGFVHEN